MSSSMGSFDHELDERGNDMSLSVLDDFEISMNLGAFSHPDGLVRIVVLSQILIQQCAGNAERMPKASGVAEDNSKQGEDDEFSPVGMTEADLQNEGVQLQDQDYH